MKVQPVASPHAIQQAPSTAQSSRSKAIEAFNKAAAASTPTPTPAPEHHSVNPNHISPEEISAVKPQTADIPDKTALVEDNIEETPVEAKKPEQDPAVKRQFEERARQERIARQKARQREEQLRSKEAELQAKEEAIRQKETQYNQGYISKDQLKADTLRILADAGIDEQALYNQMTERFVNPMDARTEQVIQRLESKIQQLEEANKKVEKSYEEQQQSAYRAAVKQIETDVKNLITNDPTFETIKATRSVSDVVELIEETYKKDGILLSVEEAATEVENYLVDEALKVTRIGKIKRRLEESGQTTKSQMKTQSQPQQTQPQMKTLTNAAASTRKLSAKERAILAFKGQLKD